MAEIVLFYKNIGITRKEIRDNLILEFLKEEPGTSTETMVYSIM